MRFVGPDGGCPEAFAACLETSQGAILAARERATQGWMAEAWLRCGNSPKGDSNPHSR